MKILVIDIGGTHVKMLVSGKRTPIKFDSSPKLTPAMMVKGVLAVTSEWEYDCVSIGYPGPAVGGHPILEPYNLGPGWVGFDYQRAFKKPVRLINDAAMQALGSYKGGRMLFLGLGTGLGSAMIVDGALQPLELAHLPYKSGQTYEDYVGAAGLQRRGKKKWRKSVLDVINRLEKALGADYVVLGGGNVKLMTELPKNVSVGSNENAYKGGFELWAESRQERSGAAFGKAAPIGRVSAKKTVGKAKKVATKD